MPPRILRPHLASNGDALSRRHHLALAAVAGSGVALLAALVAELDADEHWPMDHRIRAALATHKAPLFRASLKTAGLAGSIGVYAPATLIAMWVVAHRRRTTRHAWPIAGSVVGAAAASLLLKQLVRRPRPRALPGPENEKPSFPSGHATRASAAALAIAYVLVRERMAARGVALPLALGIAAAAGVSRAYADAHWTTDVIGGWALGGAAAATSALVYERGRAND
ncbi:MAG: phosphoesterase PA-phosphatase related protein [Gemmatimonadetes bacterium]|nr:phosphoesterase PA-phosphatase related protein [Gemmatimonadota bacterium]